MLNTGAHPAVPNALQSTCIVPAAGDFAQHVSDIVAQARSAMAAAQQRQKKAADQHRRHVTYSVGDLVMLRADTHAFKNPGSRNLLPKWVGPFRVSELVSNVNVRLELPAYGGWQRLHSVFHVSRVRPYFQRTGSLTNWQPPPLVFNSDGSLEWEVETILDHRERLVSKVRGRARAQASAATKQITHYLGRWRGWTVEHDTWEPAHHLAYAPDIVAAYRREHSLDTSEYE
jgi:hypothetical protein